MSRILTDVLARRFDEDAALIEELLALVPHAHHAWRPAWPATPDGSAPFTLLELTRHLAQSLGGVAACLQRLHPEKLAHFDSLRQRLADGEDPPRALLAACRAATAAGFARTADADLARHIKTYFQPQGEPFLEILLTNGKHLNHHAYQLFIYLKLLGVPVETRHLYRFKTPAA